jgi:hypothetical protein
MPLDRHSTAAQTDAGQTMTIIQGLRHTLTEARALEAKTTAAARHEDLPCRARDPAGPRHWGWCCHDHNKDVACALALAVGACAFSSNITPMDGITFKVTDRSYEQVWSAAVLTVTSLGSIKSMDRDKGEIRGFRQGNGAWDCGNALGVFIDPHSDGARSSPSLWWGLSATSCS